MTLEEAIEIASPKVKIDLRYFCLEHPDPMIRANFSRTAFLLAGHKPHELPSAAQQASNLAGAVGRAIAAAVTGSPVRATPEMVSQRRTICAGCVELVADRCRLCGCFFQAKIELATEKCPIDKW